MPPIEIQQQQQQMQQQNQQIALPNQAGASISLSMLIDFIVQRTYHDLTILAEL
jgi:iron-sulfur cluster repair protein YtfE (RIC family)